MKNIWIVGGSSGIGLELVKVWLNQGHNVIVSSSTATTNEELLKLKRNYLGLYLVDLDLFDDSSVSRAWDEVKTTLNSIDVWFYNAAVYDKVTIDQFEYDKFKKMNEINYLGFLKIMQYVTPYFIKQGFGRWIVNISISSYFGLPYGGAYSAPKAALLNLTQSIQPELISKNIELQVINHGFVKTRLTSKNDFEMPGLLDASDAAKRISEDMDKKYKFEISFPFGLTTFIKVLSILPYRLSLYITRKMLR